MKQIKTRNELRRRVRDPQGPYKPKVEKDKKKYCRKNSRVTY